MRLQIAASWQPLRWGLIALLAACASACSTTSDVALTATATASTPSSGNVASNAIDGNAGTRWESAQADPQWLQLDLGSVYLLCEVQITWEGAYASAYDLQTSDDGSSWSTAASASASGAGLVVTDFADGTATRYFRMYGTARGTGYSYSIWTLALLAASPSPPAPPDVAAPSVSPSPPRPPLAPPPAAPPPACGTYSSTADYDLSGSDAPGLSAFGTSDVHQCCAACSATAGCGGFVFFGNTCYFKATTATLTPSTGRVAYLLCAAARTRDRAALPIRVVA